MPGHGGRTVGIVVSYEKVIDLVKKTRKLWSIKYARLNVASDDQEKAFYIAAKQKFVRDHAKQGATMNNLATSNHKNVTSTTGWIMM
jgi:hypothetical protein